MFCHLTKIISEVTSTTFQKVRCSFFGKTNTLKVLNLYGISIGVPDNSFGIVVRPNGYGDEAFVIPDKPTDRFTGLKAWEIKIGNYEQATYIYFNEEGDVKIKPASGRKFIIEGNAEIQGDLELTAGGNITTASVSSYNTHTHGGVQTGVGSTGVPN